MGLGWEERPREKSRDTQRHQPGPPRGVGTGRRVPPGGRATAELKAASSRGHGSPPSRVRRRCDGLVASPVRVAAAAAAGGPRRNAVVLAGSTPRGGGPLPGSVGDAAGGPAGTRAQVGGRPLLSSHHPADFDGDHRGPERMLPRGRGVASPSPTPPFNPALWPYFLFPFSFLSGVRVPQLSPTPSSRNSLLPPRCTEHQLCTSGARIRVSSFRPGEGSPD